MRVLNLADVNVAFFPFAVETFGGWHVEADTQLTRIARALARQSASQESITIKQSTGQRVYAA